jgi:ABC-2 type transport system permease protein
MISQLYAITIKELKTLAHDQGALAALFLLPIVFVVVMTYAGVGNQGVRPMHVLVVNQDQGPIAQQIIHELQVQDKVKIIDQINGQPLQREESEYRLMKRGSDIAFILVFPKGFSEKLETSTPSDKSKNIVQFIADPATGGVNLLPAKRLIEMQVMNVASAMTVTREYKDMAQTYEAQAPKQSQPLLSSLKQHISVNIPKLYKGIKNNIQFQQVAPEGFATARPPTSQEQNVPGYAIFGMFFIVQVIGNTFLREKESGAFSRLLTAPIQRSVLLIGKLIPFYIVNVVQVIILFGFGYFVFHINLGHSLWGLFAVSLATAAVANALGLLIAAISKSAEQMGPMSGVILIVMATFGGILIPYFEMPASMQKLSFFTPQAWALKGFQDILVRGYDLEAVLPCVGALVLFALAFYAIALLRFRFE